MGVAAVGAMAISNVIVDTPSITETPMYPDPGPNIIVTPIEDLPTTVTGNTFEPQAPTVITTPIQEVQPTVIEQPMTGEISNISEWTLGDPINSPTKNGYPSWSTVQSRYWKNKAHYSAPGEYSDTDLERMAIGNAPLHPTLGVPMELHHKNGRAISDPHNANNLEEVWPWEHAAQDPFRHYKGPEPE